MVSTERDWLCMYLWRYVKAKLPADRALYENMFDGAAINLIDILDHSGFSQEAWMISTLCDSIQSAPANFQAEIKNSLVNVY